MSQYKVCKMSKKILRLICNPDTHFSKKSDSYKVNELLKSSEPIVWKIPKLKDINIGMRGIIRVGDDNRSKALLEKHSIGKLESGIYAIIEVIERLDNSIKIQIINNFFRENKIIVKEKALKIDEKLFVRSQGYLDEKVFNKLKKYAPIPVIKNISIKNYFFLENIELINLHNKKEIYIVGENGDGKTLFLQALVLALRGNEETVNHLIKDTRNKMKLSVIDSNGDEYRYVKNDNNYKNVIAYGVHRSRYKGSKNINGYLGLFDSDLNLNNIENWLKDLELAELKQEKQSIPLSIVKKMLMQILDNNLTDIEITNGKVNFMERGSSVTINELSEGYKSVIIWVSDLLSRLIKLQPNVEDMREFRGVVLVDEIDLHLHPKWGYSIVEKLRDWFPNIQFIFTTHSPTVILGSSEDAIFFKIYKEDKVSKISQPVDNIKNLMANSVSTSPLFNLPDAWARNNNGNIDTSDDFLYSKIHKQIAEYNRDKKSITEEDIFKMIGETLRELTKDDEK